MVHSRRMAIVPGNLDCVSSNELNSRGANPFFYLFATDDPFARVLVHARCAGAVESELRVAQGVFMAVAKGEQDVSRA